MSGDSILRPERVKPVEVRDKNWAEKKLDEHIETVFEPVLGISLGEVEVRFILEKALPVIFKELNYTEKIGLVSSMLAGLLIESLDRALGISFNHVKTFIDNVNRDAELRSYYEREKGNEAEKKKKRDEACSALLLSCFSQTWDLDRVLSFVSGDLRQSLQKDWSLKRYVTELINMVSPEQMKMILQAVRRERERRAGDIDPVIQLFEE